MNHRSPTSIFRKVLLPVVHDCDCVSALRAAQLIAGNGQVVLFGIVRRVSDESLSAGADEAHKVRSRLHQLRKLSGNIKVIEPVHVSSRPWEEVCKQAEREAADLLVLQWPDFFEVLQTPLIEVFTEVPCELAIASGPIPEKPDRVLAPLRGGPNAELALRVSLAISHTSAAKISSLHIISPNMERNQDAPYRGLEQILESMPYLEREVIETGDPKQAIIERALNYPLTVVGTVTAPVLPVQGFGPVAQAVLCETTGGVIIVRTKRVTHQPVSGEKAGLNAISILVDQWFAENTYQAEEFEDLEYLLDLKKRQDLTISLALPALNEEETVGNVIHTIKTRLMDEAPLIDEMILIDSNSTDRTREIAQAAGIPVYIHQQILSEYEARRGKGEALWKSLFVTRGDVILWMDTDIVNIDPRFIYGLIGPLLLRPEIQFVKGFYRRPLRVGNKLQAGGGGRVTELTARPMINLFYPEISGIVQPLSGEYGGRRSALERLPFFSGYGVEIGLLIDMFEQFGLQAIAQVDLQERVHHNQTLESLSKMSFAIIQAIVRKLERRYNRNFLHDLNKSMKLIRHNSGRYYLEVEEIAEQERPPMILLEEYRQAMQA